MAIHIIPYVDFKRTSLKLGKTAISNDIFSFLKFLTIFQFVLLSNHWINFVDAVRR